MGFSHCLIDASVLSSSLDTRLSVLDTRYRGNVNWMQGFRRDLRVIQESRPLATPKDETITIFEIMSGK
jgi:hypothetical protein